MNALKGAVTALLSCACLGSTAQAAHPWIAMPPKLAPEAYFSNLKDGQEIEAPYVVRFGLTGIGIAAITKPVKRTGHHHLLVNNDLPMDFTKPLPFSDKYIHFGKGQMEQVFNMPPGDYTLRLVFADHRHIPNFVYSPPVKIKVTAQNKAVDPKTLVKTGAEILQPAAGSTVRPPFRIAFHGAGLNISHVDITDPGAGHFRLQLERGGKAETFDFTSGDTEVWLTPPSGPMTAKVEYIDNASGKVVHTSSTVGFNVGNR